METISATGAKSDDAMSWITVIWSISAGACLTLAFLQFIVWWKDRAARANLVFAVGAVAVAVFAGLELGLMRAETPAQFDAVARWIHVPGWVLIVSIVAFVRLYLNAGRRWLAWTVVGLRTLALILNFVLSPNINYRKVTALRHMPFLGEPISVPVGVPNPWMLVAQFSLLLLVIYVVDATITVWRRGNRRQALVVGGSIVLLVLLASAQAVAMTWGIMATPLTVSLFYLILVAAMAYELSYDLIRAAQLTRRLQASEATLRESEERFRIVADAAPVLIWMSGVDKLCNFFNKPWLEFTGRTLEQELGNGWAEGVHPDDLQRCLKVYTESFDARKLFVMQYRLRRHDGEYRWISDTGVPRYDTQKNFDGYIGSCVDVTEFINKEQALRDSEERMSLAAKAAGFIVWTWDIARDEVWLSDKDRALFGFSQSEKLNAERIRSVVYPEDRHLVSQLVQNSLTTEKELEAEYRIVLGDSRVRWVTRRGRVEFDGNGEPTWERGVLMDITELKRKEEALREFEERVVLAAEAAHLGVWELDTATAEMWMSDSARSLFGFDSNTHLTHAVFQNRLHPEDRARRDSAVKAVIENQGEYELEYRTILPDGSVRWIGGRGRCVRKDNSTRLIGVSIDITAQKQAQELFRLATEASLSGLVLVNDHGKIVLVNSHVEELFGYRREELIGKPVDVLVPERFASQHPAHRGTFLAAPTARAMGAGRELFARRKDGSEFPVEIGLNPIQTPEGILVLAAVVDISARKTAEEGTRRNREQVELLSRVSLLGEMTASLAHELNQPLAAIVNNATAAIQYLEQGRLNPEQLQDILTDVVGDGRRACDIMQNVRSAIKKGSAIRGPINLNDVVKAVAHMVQADAAAQSCKIELSLTQDLPAIEGDPTQIQQVLINLVRNAFDAMRDGPPSRRVVEIVTNYNSDRTISVAVRDYGTGISEATRERLFEQFFTTKEEGLGMGLAIVRSIVEAHGGSTAAENADGGGARFYFRLPIKEETPA